MRSVALLSVLTLLSGCSLVERIGNKPYVFPHEGEPASSLMVNYAPGSGIAVYNMDENGCFAGTSAIGPSGTTVMVHANKELFMAAETRSANSFCSVMFSFTPETDARYVLYQGIRLEKATGALGFLSPSDVYCTVSGERILSTGGKESPVLKKMNLRPSGLACLKMREVADKK